MFPRVRSTITLLLCLCASPATGFASSRPGSLKRQRHGHLLRGPSGVSLPVREEPGLLRRPSVPDFPSELKLVTTARGGEFDGRTRMEQIRGRVAAPLMEALGTGLIALVVAITGSPKLGMSVGLQTFTVIALLASLIYTGDRISGAQFNPAVTFCMVLLGKTKPSQGVVNTLAQVVGAVAGGFLGKALLGPGWLADQSFKLTGATAATELLNTFALLYIIMQTAIAKAQAGNVFFVVAILAQIAAASGMSACMNPAVSSGLMVAAGTVFGIVARWLLPMATVIPAVAAFRVTSGDYPVSPILRRARPFIMEALGTFLLAGSMVIVMIKGGFAVPVAAGLMLTALAFAGEYMSGGAHLNPAVTLGLWLRQPRLMSVQRVGAYVASQVLGAVTAVSALTYAFGSGPLMSKVSVPPLGHTLAQAFVAEALFTGLLVKTVLHMRVANIPLSGLAVGGAYMAGLFTAGPISGLALNPVVSAALFLQQTSTVQLRKLWVYCVAPLVGAVGAVVLTNVMSPLDKHAEAPAAGVKQA